MNKNLIQEILSAKYLFQYERGRVISEQKKVNLSESVLKNVLSEQSDMATKLTTFSEDDKKGPDEVGITWTPISLDDYIKLEENATGNYVVDKGYGFKDYFSLVNNKKEGYNYTVNDDGTWIKCPYKNDKYGGICVYKNNQGAYVKGYCGKTYFGGADKTKFRGVGTVKYDGKTQEQLDTLTKRHYEKLNTEIKQNPATEMNPDALKVGDRGEKVKELQQRLIDKGVTDPKTGKVIIKDGKFGPATQRTLEKFEAEINKPVEIQQPGSEPVQQPGSEPVQQPSEITQFPFASQEEYTQFKEWMKKSNPTVYTDMGGTGEPNEWNSVMAKVYEKLKTDWETHKQLLVQTVASETKQEWYYRDETGEKNGPFTKGDLLTAINSNGNTPVSKSGMNAFVKAWKIRALGLPKPPPPSIKRDERLRGTVGYPITTKDKEPPPTRQK